LPYYGHGKYDIEYGGPVKVPWMPHARPGWCSIPRRGDPIGPPFGSSTLSINKMSPQIRAHLNSVMFYNGYFSLSGRTVEFLWAKGIQPAHLCTISPFIEGYTGNSFTRLSFGSEPWHDQLEELKVRIDTDTDHATSLHEFAKQLPGLEFEKVGGRILKAVNAEPVSSTWTGLNEKGHSVTWHSRTIVWKDAGPPKRGLP
jgi:hypothetical protein